MKLNILVVGDCIKLLKDKEVTLVNAGQNEIFLKKYDNNNKNIKSIKKDERHLKIPKGTVLKVDRVYIRKGSGSDYNSLTFVSKNNEKFLDGRFFLPVSVVNELDVEILKSDINQNKKPIHKQVFDRALEMRKETGNYKDDYHFEAFKEFFDDSDAPIYNCQVLLNLDLMLKKIHEKNFLNKIYEKVLKETSLKPKDKVSIKNFYDYLINEKQFFENIKTFNLAKIVGEISFYKIRNEFVIKFNNHLFDDEDVVKKAVYLYNYNKFIEFLLIKGLVKKDEFKEYHFLKNINYFIKNEFGSDFLSPSSGIMNLEGYKGLVKNSSNQSEFFIFYDFIKYFAFFNAKYIDSDYVNYSDKENMLFDVKTLRSKMTKIKKINKTK